MADKDQKLTTPFDLENDNYLNTWSFYNTGSAMPGVAPGDADLFFNYGREQYPGKRNVETGRPANANGQYAAYPGATPKYVRHRPGRPRENYDTLARMYIRVNGPKAPDNIRQHLKNSVSKNVAEVMLGDGSGASPALGYVDFFLDTIQKNHTEKVQVTDVLEDNFVAFFFGASPPVYTFSGHVMNTLQDDWAVQMLSAYEDLFRGTMLAKRGLQLYIRYDSYIISGACTSIQMTHSAANETIIPFSLQMLVHRTHLMYGNAYGASILPESAGSFIPNGVQLNEPKPQQIKVWIAPPGKETAPTDGINTIKVQDGADVSADPDSQTGMDREVRQLMDVSGDPSALPASTARTAPTDPDAGIDAAFDEAKTAAPAPVAHPTGIRPIPGSMSGSNSPGFAGFGQAPADF